MEKMLKKLLFISLLFLATMPFEVQATFFNRNAWINRAGGIGIFALIAGFTYCFIRGVEIAEITTRFVWKKYRTMRFEFQGVVALFIAMFIPTIILAANSWIKNRWKDIDLLNAVAFNNLAQAEKALQSGADASLAWMPGWKNLPIIVSALDGNLGMVELLVDYNADVNAKNKRDTTVLMFAAKHNHEEIVKFLLEKNADINKKDSDGKIALRYAFEAENAEIIDLLKKDHQEEISGILKKIFLEEEKFKEIDILGIPDIIADYTSDLLLTEEN